MVRRLPDLMSGDLFDVPQPVPATPGGMACGREIAHAMSAALKACPHDRIEVAARMTRLLGREVPLSMLNAYTAESAERHTISLERAIAFDAATEGYGLLEFFAKQRGCSLNVGKAVLLAELGRFEQMKAEIARQERAIKKYLEHGGQ